MEYQCAYNVIQSIVGADLVSAHKNEWFTKLQNIVYNPLLNIF